MKLEKVQGSDKIIKYKWKLRNENVQACDKYFTINIYEKEKDCNYV